MKRNRLPRNRKGGQVGLRTHWSKEREDPTSGMEPYDASVTYDSIEKGVIPLLDFKGMETKD